MKRNMNEWLEQVLHSDKKESFPVLSFPAIQKMGVTVRDLTGSSDLQAQALKTIRDNAPDMIAIGSFMDLSVEAEAFGSNIRFSDEEVPTVIGNIVNTMEDIEALPIPEIGAGRTQLYVDGVKKTLELVNDRPVFAGCIGPFSLAGRLLDVNKAVMYTMRNKKLLHAALEKCTEFIIKYIKSYREIGAAGVLMAEPLAGLLSPKFEKEFSGEYVKRIVEEVQTEEFLVVYHNCGNGTPKQLESLFANGCRMFHFGNAVDMGRIVPNAPEDIIVMGNVDPAGEFRNGTPESVKAATEKLLEEFGSYHNFVISSGCDIPPMSSWDNINAFFGAVKEYNERK